MAEDNSTQATGTRTTEAVFKPNKWGPDDVENCLIPGRTYSEFVRTAHDVSYGVAAILEMPDVNALEKADTDGAPILSEYHAGVLLRLAITSVTMVGDKAERSIERARKTHTPEGREPNRAA